MKVQFSKMQGAGNDFVVLSGLESAVVLEPETVRRLCDRHFGVGADQVLTIEPGACSAEVVYRIFNTDGTEAEHCGNGARCAALYWFDRSGVPATSVRLRTMNRVLDAHRSPDGSISVSMGAPVFATRVVRFNPPATWAKHEIGLQTYWRLPDLPISFSVASMGNPHAVVWVQDLDSTPVQRWGTAIQGLTAFPNSANVSFAQIRSRSSIRIRTFERVVGETLACGSGACAVAAIGARSGWLDREVQVSAPGGDLRTRRDSADDMTLSGPAAFVFDGEITL